MSKINWKRLALATSIPVAVVAFVGFFPEVALVLLLLGMFALIVYFIYEFIGLCYGDDKD